MPDPADAFLDAAVRSFDDNAELQIVARRELEEAIRTSPDRGDALDTLRQRFDQEDAKPRHWGKIARVVLAVISLALVGWTLASLYAQRDEIHWFQGMGSWDLDPMPPEKIARGLSPAERLLLLGDPDASPSGDRMKGLWRSDPGSPAYLAEHARWQVREEKTLPPELLEEALKLEPDNGYMHYVAAVAEAPGCVKPLDVARKRGVPPPLTPYEIVDEARWQRVLDHLHTAVAAPRFKSYEKELLLRRLPLLPAAADVLSLAPRCDYLFGRGSASVHGFWLTQVVSTKAQECLKQGDREGFLKLIEGWDRLVVHLLADARPTLLNMVTLRGTAGSPLDHFIAAAEGLELPGIAAKLRDRKERLSRDHSPLKQAMNFEEAQRESRLYGRFFQLAFHPEMPREEELRPGRLAEYALIDRLVALVGWSALAVAALAAGCYRFRGSPFARRMSRRLAELVRPVDCFRVMGAGVALPFLLVLAMIHFTPLGSRAWSFSTQGGIIVAGQLLAVVLLILLVPPLIARRRLAQRAGRVGLASEASHMSWLVVGMAAAAVPVFGLAQWASLPEPLMEDGGFLEAASFFDFDPGEAHGAGKAWLWTGVGLLAVSASWGVVTVLRLIFSRQKHLPRRLALSRMVFPAYLAGTLMFALAMPAYHAVERHWFAKDATMTFAAEDWGLTPVEARLRELELAQIRDALESTR